MPLHIDRSQPRLLKVRFTIDPVDPEGPVSVVGSFNDWVPGLDELIPDGHGMRSVTVGLPYGERLIFRYLAADDTWFDEPDADLITPEGSILLPVAEETP